MVHLIIITMVMIMIMIMIILILMVQPTLPPWGEQLKVARFLCFIGGLYWLVHDGADNDDDDDDNDDDDGDDVEKLSRLLHKIPFVQFTWLAIIKPQS